MWDELVNFFDLTVTKEDIKRYNEMKKKRCGGNDSTRSSSTFTKNSWRI